MQFDFNLPWVINISNNLQITSYQIIVAINLIIGYFLARQIFFKEKTINKVDFDLFYGISIVIIFVSASIFTLAVNFLIFSPKIVIFNLNRYSGISSFGGIIGLFISLYVFTVTKYRLGSFYKMVNPVIIIGFIVLGIGRLGCLTSGCCYGKVCKSFLFVTYKREFYAPINIQLIPIQLYEAIFVLILSSYSLYKYRHDNENIWLKLVVGYAIFRFFDEFFRGEEINQIKLIYNLNIYQIIILFFLFTLFIIKTISYINEKIHLKSVGQKII